ncbi:MAG TPA: TIGR01777 family oxidoreductase [Candidatus Sulfotelmatobacter sp.]|nr:TIGR01777 family oxidoreductase [Candidatus Sulfotelmatobacter sp.]
MNRILVSGVSGPIGSALLPLLQSRGCEVVRLTRSPIANASSQIAWAPDRPIEPEKVSGFDAVIHLAGESIIGRWTASKKAKIRDSRVVGTGNLADALSKTARKPMVFVCSSAIGYYGSRGDEVLNETSPAGSGFLADVCREWETATQSAVNSGIRTVNIRTGVVLSPKGGALGKMLTPFKLGVGGRIGSGRQWMSWIDVQDMAGAIHYILETESLRGPVNMVAPNPVTNEEFTRTLARVLSRPAIFPLPAFVVKAAFGEMGEAVLLGSQRVQAARLMSAGYPFRSTDLESCLRGTLQR